MSHLNLREFADKMGEIVPIVMREFAKRQVDAIYEGKITLPQALALEFLNSKGEMKMKDLAKLMNISTAAITGIVDRLVKSGYAKRDYDSRDRRIIKVCLTSKGTGLIGDINQQRRKMIINIFGKVSEEDRYNYLRILTKIRDILIKDA